MSKRVCVVCGARKHIDNMKLVSDRSEKNRYACNGWLDNCAQSYLTEKREEKKSIEKAEIRRHGNEKLNTSIREMKSVERRELVNYKESVSQTKNIDEFIFFSRKYYSSIDSFKENTDVSVKDSMFTPFEELKIKMREEIIYVRENIFLNTLKSVRNKKANALLVAEINNRYNDIFLDQEEYDLNCKLKAFNSASELIIENLVFDIQKETNAENFVNLAEKYINEWQDKKRDLECLDSDLASDRVGEVFGEIKKILDRKWFELHALESKDGIEKPGNKIEERYAAIFWSPQERQFHFEKNEAIKYCQAEIDRISADRFIFFKGIFPNLFILAYHKMWLYFIICLIVFPAAIPLFPIIVRRLLLKGYRKRVIAIKKAHFGGRKSLDRMHETNQSLNPTLPLWYRLINSYIKNTFYGFLIIIFITIGEIIFTEDRTIANTDWAELMAITVFLGWIIPSILGALARGLITTISDVGADTSKNKR